MSNENFNQFISSFTIHGERDDFLLVIVKSLSNKLSSSYSFINHILT